jgi:hypothetical protein
MEKVKAIFPSKVKFMWGAKATLRGEAPNQVETFDLYAIKVTDRSGKAAMFGDIITDARSDFNAQSGGHPYISMTMTGEAATNWAKLTKANSPKSASEKGHSIAVVMDNMVYSAPTVNGEIKGGQSQITGNFTVEEANALAAVLSAGKLPAPARIVEESVVGPSLGQESINSGFMSFALGLLMVIAWMILYYGKAGVYAENGVSIQIEALNAPSCHRSAFLNENFVWYQSLCNGEGYINKVLTGYDTEGQSAEIIVNHDCIVDGGSLFVAALTTSCLSLDPVSKQMTVIE